MLVGRILGTVIVLGAVGVGVALLAPGVARAARPLARSALARALSLAQDARMAAEGAWEDLEDLAAEATAKMQAQRAGRGGPSARVVPLRPEGASHG